MSLAIPLPCDFPDRVISHFPEYAWLPLMFNFWSEQPWPYELGRLLRQGRGIRMSPEDIVAAFIRGRSDLVLEAAKEALEREKLHAEWCAMRRHYLSV